MEELSWKMDVIAKTGYHLYVNETHLTGRMVRLFRA